MPPGSGSPRAVNAMNEQQAMLRDTFAKYQGKLALNQAYFAAKSKRWEGNQAVTTGLIDAGSTVLTTGLMARGSYAADLGLPPSKTNYPLYLGGNW